MSESLIGLIFHPLDSDGLPQADRFFADGDLPATAELLCKFSGLLLQAYWLLLRENKRDAEIPKELDYLVSQIWAGHWDFTEGMAISLLRSACMASPSSGVATLVRRPETFEKWREVIQHRNMRYKRLMNILDSEDWYQEFANLLKSLPILKVAQYDNGSFRFEGLPAVPSFPFIFTSRHFQTPLFLYSFKPVTTRAAIRFEDPYGDYAEEVPFESIGDLRDRFDLIRQTLGLERIQRGYVCLFGGDYQNLTDLAWAISEEKEDAHSIGDDPLHELMERFKRENDKMADELERLETVDLVTIAIATDGPTRVLRRLLRPANRGLFERYLKHLEQKKGEDSLQQKWSSFFAQHLQHRTDKANPFLANDSEIRDKVLENIKLDTLCWCLIKAAGLKIDAPPNYVESIGMRLRMVNALWERYDKRHEIEKETVIVNVAQLFERTLRFLICFYSGLKAYYESFSKSPLDYPAHEARMLDAAKEAYENIRGATPGTLYYEVFRKQLYHSMKKGEELKTLLGRDHIFHLKTFDSLVAKWFEPVNPTKHDHTELFFEEHLTSFKTINHARVKAFVHTTIDLFTFLKDGVLSKTGSNSMDDMCVEPVYPMVVSFREEHRKRDGFSIYNYSVHLSDPIADKDSDIMILTSREHLSNEQYYCVPCRRKSVRDWWLDPFLIRCSKFHGASHGIDPEDESAN